VQLLEDVISSLASLCSFCPYTLGKTTDDPTRGGAHRRRVIHAEMRGRGPLAVSKATSPKSGDDPEGPFPPGDHTLDGARQARTASVTACIVRQNDAIDATMCTRRHS
jgi:hypothetical protein